MIEIVPSILSADFARLADDIARVERGGAKMLHLDVMDGHFVPNLTIGPPVVECVRKATKLSPALAYPCRHSLGIALHLRRCLRGFLLQVLRVLLLSAARERSQQQNCGNVPISEEDHFDQLLSAVLDDISALSGWPFLRARLGRGPSAEPSAVETVVRLLQN